jgi:hypothetical protein
MRTGCSIFPFEFEEKPEVVGRGESLKEGLSCRKPLRKPYEGIASREKSTDYHNPLIPGEKE